MVQQPNVAVIMATYNGAKYVHLQIKSLLDNRTSFSLHWLDDHSTDSTRETVRDTAASLGVQLVEWHQPQRQGVPAAFFQLLECVEADIYLFCDQDDIWQPGKIDAAATDLIPDIGLPALCFSDPLMFYEDSPDTLVRLSRWWKIRKPEALCGIGCLILNPAAGQSIGFTRPLRDIFVRHSAIARKYAWYHSTWMVILASATGTIRMMKDVPTTLYRRHGDNVTGSYYERNRGYLSYLAGNWRITHYIRQRTARQAQGLIHAAPFLPPGPMLDQFLSLAPLVATFHRRQSVLTLLRLAARGLVIPSATLILWIFAACLCTDARES